MPLLSEIRQRRAEQKYQEADAKRLEEEQYVKNEATDREAMQDKTLRAREKILARKQKERALEREEREYQHPVRTRAIRRAEKMAGLGADRAQKVAGKSVRVASSQTKTIIHKYGKPRQLGQIGRSPRDSQRTRLPVFAQGSPGFSERVAMDFGAKAPEEILKPSQQQPILGNKTLELFGAQKQYDLGIGSNKQYDLGIGNGNKKKVRYY